MDCVNICEFRLQTHLCLQLLLGIWRDVAQITRVATIALHLLLQPGLGETGPMRFWGSATSTHISCIIIIHI